MSERERIARIAAILRGGRARVDIGDDAAVIDPVAGPLVLTVDEQVEGTHFERRLCSLEDIGFRATMAAASDLAAMGASPVAALAAWVLPVNFTDDDAEHIACGQREACDEISRSLGSAGVFVVGGNLARGPVLSIATTWVGTCASPITRAGAKPGDRLYVCGALGLASAGFAMLSASRDTPRDAARAWRRPRALVVEGLRMATVAHACVDVSDGLAGDCDHLARASGVRVVLDEAVLRKNMHSATIEIARALGRDTIDFVLAGGEDYALVCASPSPIEGFVRIGAIERGEGVVLRGENGDRDVCGGFDHFA